MIMEDVEDQETNDLLMTTANKPREEPGELQTVSIYTLLGTDAPQTL